MGLVSCGSNELSSSINGDSLGIISASSENVTTSSIAHVHDMIFIEGSEATCEKDGSKDYYYCSECNKNFYDEEGTEEVESLDDLVIPASHDFGEYVPYSGGIYLEHAKTCSKCGYRYLERHDFDENECCTICGFERNFTEGFEFTLNEDGKSYMVSSKGTVNTKNYIRVVIPNYYQGLPVTKLGDNLFMSDTNIVSIDIPDTVEVIGAMAFYGCRNLEIISIPNNLKTIEKNAFRRCDGIELIYLDSAERYSQIEFKVSNPINFLMMENPNPLSYSGKAYLVESNYLINPKYDADLSKGQNLKFSSDIKKINPYAYAYAPYIMDVNFEGDIEIGEMAFAFCGQLGTANFKKNSHVSLSNDCFKASGLRSLVLPNVDVFDNPFAHCEKLKTIQILSAKSISGLNDCTSLRDVYMSSDLEIIENQTFEGCSALKSIVIRSNVKKIGYRAFNECTSLDEVTFEDYENWYYGEYSSTPNYQSIDFSSPSKNAEYLTSTYVYNIFAKDAEENVII